ncbi:selenocysteine-specific translation elongation factor [Bradyrhizobium sp. CB2312]|uniref:selenocysteine-specific translation elongation factor n=1 Tax=Bradyrhizobium sp. CB2312 TaxID=3039155 RepID=UPI0024B0A8F4|nr:selenocysteine-specific translation elongation factor [Bradyrhizobium sp. CB2312]WFU76860.1 selenocysteine-specific translation elongation factor [Bradyrhizobium sp. CB2312]
MIVGTAGHIDHGKTALVKALTGVDGDRLKEEKARGITIDLGFAFLPIAKDKTLGFIDVPGHERLVHTMLAGSTGIDVALLVVAADDGVMPQTREHLAILDLLGIERAIVALTKVDIATPERIEEVTSEISRAIAGTKLEGAEIIPVSARKGEGIASLRRQLEAAMDDIPKRSSVNRFRLAVDRVFTLTGVGVVVTGTVLSGSVCPGDRVTVSPSGLTARVRSLHAQSEPAERGQAGDRCALNLVGDGVSRESIHRGDMVLDPKLHAPTDRIDARLHLLPGETRALRQRLPVRLHHGSAEVGAHIVILSNETIQPGDAADVQLVLDRPIAATVPDRFIVRDVSAQRTLGGGRFIDLRPPARKRRTIERQAQRAAHAIVEHVAAIEALLATPPFAWDIAVIARDRALTASRIKEISEALRLVLLDAGTSLIAIAPRRWQAFGAMLVEQLTAYHAENPDAQGIGRDKLRLLLQPKLPAAVFVVALQKVAVGGNIVLDGSFVRMATHAVRLASRDEAAWANIAPLLAGETRFRPPRVRDIGMTTSYPERDVRRLLKMAGRLGWVDEVAHDRFFLRSTVHELATIAAGLAACSRKSGFTAAQFRDRVDNGRKVAIQILEFLDRHGVTVNRDELRRVNTHCLDLFASPAPTFDKDNGRESSLVGRSDFKSG